MVWKTLRNRDQLRSEVWSGLHHGDRLSPAIEIVVCIPAKGLDFTFLPVEKCSANTIAFEVAADANRVDSRGCENQRASGTSGRIGRRRKGY